MAVCHTAMSQQGHYCKMVPPACSVHRPPSSVQCSMIIRSRDEDVLLSKPGQIQHKPLVYTAMRPRHKVQTRAQLVEASSPSAASPSSSSDLSTPYENTFLDDVFYKMFRSRCQEELGWTSSDPEFPGLIEESRRLLRKYRTKTQVEEATVRILRSLFPPHLLPLFKRLIPPLGGGKPAAILLARVTQATCQWLMGRCSMNEVQLADGSMLKSGVFIEKCKYLEESKCAGICIHTCKVPTQLFIRGDMGVPLTMEPNYEDFSCQFKFGVDPPPREQDKALSTPCLAACPVAAARQSIRYVPDSEQCPQVS